jgi:hypothetical protein
VGEVAEALRRSSVTRLVLAAFLLAAMAFAPGAIVAPTIFSKPVEALHSGSSVISQLGFDTACAPTIAQMNTLWLDSPWWWVGVYIGGDNIACKGNPNLSGYWLNTVHSQDGEGWEYAFYWAGDQDPCTDPAEFYQFNGTNARTRADSNATAARAELLKLGLDGAGAGTPVTYDLEAYGKPAPGSSCQLAADAFMAEWTSDLHSGTAILSGVYGSTCDSNLDLLAGVSPAPDYIFGSDPDGNPSTSDMSCVSSGHWVTNQRLKQYQINLPAPNYGVPIPVDYDCSHGPVAPAGSSGGSAC